MKILLVAFSFFTVHMALAQDDIVRLPNEKAEHLVKRFFKTAEDSAALHDSTLSFVLEHPVVEVNFGAGDQPKIVTCFNMNGSWGICIGVLVTDDRKHYTFSYLGGEPWGVAPDMDTIRSIFTYDSNGNGIKELMVLCATGERVVHDGMSGCCESICFTKIFTYRKNELEIVDNYKYEGTCTAAEVKTIIHQTLYPPVAKPKKSPKNSPKIH